MTSQFSEDLTFLKPFILTVLKPKKTIFKNLKPIQN